MQSDHPASSAILIRKSSPILATPTGSVASASVVSRSFHGTAGFNTWKLFPILSLLEFKKKKNEFTETESNWLVKRRVVHCFGSIYFKNSIC